MLQVDFECSQPTAYGLQAEAITSGDTYLGGFALLRVCLQPGCNAESTLKDLGLVTSKIRDTIRTFADPNVEPSLCSLVAKAGLVAKTLAHPLLALVADERTSGSLMLKKLGVSVPLLQEQLGLRSREEQNLEWCANLDNIPSPPKDRREEWLGKGLARRSPRIEDHSQEVTFRQACCVL
jgi:hypothetical protein